MTSIERTDGGGAAYRGFLFSDMRGFTAFAERHGNAAAAAMVGRFLDLARTAIARHDGAEIKTEGDAIHAVFPSASGAVMCGLDLVDAAAELNEKDPSRPLNLGVGVHAGEAVETAEGYIGRAVNIAARLCAVAKPGEVLVSSTVKGITQASITVGFIPRGRRRLKGIADPILVYAVTRDATAGPPRTVPRPIVLGLAGGGVIVALIAAVVIGMSLFGGSPLASEPAGPSPTAAPTAQPVAMGPLAIGTYASTAFQPAFSFDIVDTGWAANRDGPGLLGLVRESVPEGFVAFARIWEVIENPCIEGGEGSTGPIAGDVVGLLEALGHVEVQRLEPVEIGGLVGQRADVIVADGALAACGGVVGAEVALFGLVDEVWRASPGERFRLVSIDVGGETVTVLMSIDWTKTHSVQELERLMQVGERLLGTVRF